MVNNFKFDIIDRFPGYNSSKDKTNLKPGFLIRGSKNVYRKESGTIAVRPGLKLRGATDSASAGVKASFEWEASVGVTKPLRVANSKLQVESDIVTTGTYVWYDLITGLTSTQTRFVFDTWWDNTVKRDILLFVRGDSNLFKWSGGVGKISSTTSTTIVLNATAASLGFDTSGTVIINGTEYAYTGVTSATLTGVTGDPTGEAVNSVVVAKPVTTANTPASGFNNDFLKVINNQVYVGSYTSRLIYVSEDDDYLDYTVPSPRAPGDPELIVLDNLARGIGVSNGEAYISAGTSDWYRVRFNQITVSTTLTEQTIVDKSELAGLEAALAHEYISSYRGSVAYLSRDQQFMVLGVFTNQTQIKPATLSLAIKEELKNATFSPVRGETSGGELRVVGQKTYIISEADGKGWVHESRENLSSDGQIVAERFWQPPQVWGISRIAVIAGVEYGHSLSYPQIYQIWDTDQWKDDSPGGDSIPYDAIMRLAYRSGRNELIKTNMAYYEGYMSQDTRLKSKFYGDYQGSTSLQALELNTDARPSKFFTGFSAVSLGDSSLGDNPLGEGLTEEELSQEQLPKFRRIKDLAEVDVFEVSLEVYSEEADSRWEILAVGLNISKNPNIPTFIR